MSEVNFKSLQTQHESLLQKQQNITKKNQQDFTKEVREYIEQAKRGGSNIASTRERDQVRANLRYWANYIYGIEGVFPDTELAPSMVTDKRPVSSIVAIIVIVILTFLGAVQTLRSLFDVPAETPSVTPTSISNQTTATQITPTSQPITPVDATPTSIFDTVVLVVLTSPENGANVLPKVQFTGVSANLKAEDTIHLLIVRGDLFFPIKEFVPQGQVSAIGDWKIDTLLYRDEKELEQPENLIVVPAICFDQQCRDTLDASVDTGIASKNLPSQLSFRLYQDSSRVLFRNAYQAVQETRLVYSRIVETSTGDKPYDLFTSKVDGGDIRQLTFTPDINEDWPNLSPDGTKIAYVHFEWAIGVYSIHIIDSNGQNDQEITTPQEYILENPQWSPDGEYISYALGNTTRSASATYWSIHAYHLSTKEDINVSGEEGPLILNRYHSWVPNSRNIVFNAGTKNTGTSGFIKVSIDNLSDQTLFFDTKADEVQPALNDLGGGYILTYTIINPVTFYHGIYAVIDTDKELPFDGSPIRLTNENYGADFPIFEPNSNSIYYIGAANNIYAIEIIVDGNKITSVNGPDSIGNLIIKSDPNERIADFDIGYMYTFFPAP